jgi:hypothetical protein
LVEVRWWRWEIFWLSKPRLGLDWIGLKRKQKGIENKEWSGRTQRRWIDGNGNSGERGLALCQQQANAAVSDAVGC